VLRRVDRRLRKGPEDDAACFTTLKSSHTWACASGELVRLLEHDGGTPSDKPAAIASTGTRQSKDAGPVREGDRDGQLQSILKKAGLK
jgi:hypothetical protein